MFASSFSAGPRFNALRAVLILFLPVASLGWSNDTAAASHQSGKLDNKPQAKDSLPEKGLTAEAKAMVRNVVPAVGLVLVKNGDERKLAYRGSAVVVRSD